MRADVDEHVRETGAMLERSGEPIRLARVSVEVAEEFRDWRGPLLVRMVPDERERGFVRIELQTP